jgi:hypothetical protein
MYQYSQLCQFPNENHHILKQLYVNYLFPTLPVAVCNVTKILCAIQFILDSFNDYVPNEKVIQHKIIN